MPISPECYATEGALICCEVTRLPRLSSSYFRLRRWTLTERALADAADLLRASRGEISPPYLGMLIEFRRAQMAFDVPPSQPPPATAASPAAAAQAETTLDASD